MTPLDSLHAGFLSLLPQVQLHATIFFRHLRCPHSREDAVAETVALAWSWYRRLVERGRDPALFVTTLATYAARHVRSGRKLCGQEPGKDVLSPLAQARHGFVVCKLPEWETLSTNPLVDALTDNTRSPVDEQVCFRLDFPVWLNTLSERDQRVVEDLMLGERTLDVARKHGLSPGRVSQLRREFLEGWRHFCGEGEDGRAGTLV
jgi:hypothetical protein